ncbi:hypothetical protein MRB53_023875 [Persea americana]|uniref:Uncharacterized protein n=1 Tax=Persea americana TaxID=3435 RepID=A0ACC2LAJ4_PERAE|nr:hypothetical protein MRB53_023875 [Persea americana]
MDQRVEQLEQAMASLSIGQQGILSGMTEMFDQLAARVEETAAQTGQESGDNSRASGRVTETNEKAIPNPRAVLYRCVQKGKSEILVHWQGLPPAEATWENVDFLKNQFPGFHP